MTIDIITILSVYRYDILKLKFILRISTENAVMRGPEEYRDYSEIWWPHNQKLPSFHVMQYFNIIF